MNTIPASYRGKLQFTRTLWASQDCQNNFFSLECTYTSAANSLNLSRNNVLKSCSYVNGIISKFLQYYGKFTSLVIANRLPSEMLVV
jgi:hypothetical protein